MIDRLKPQRDVDTTSDEDFWDVLAGRREPREGNSSEARAAALRDIYLRRRDRSRNEDAVESAIDTAHPTPVLADDGPAIGSRRSQTPRRYFAAVACVAGLVGVLVGHLWPQSTPHYGEPAPPRLETRTPPISQLPRATRGPASESHPDAVSKGLPSSLEAAPGEAESPEFGRVDSDLALGVAVGIWLKSTLDACDAPADAPFDWRDHAGTLVSLARRLEARDVSEVPALETTRRMGAQFTGFVQTSQSIRRELCGFREQMLYAIHATDLGTSAIDDTG